MNLLSWFRHLLVPHRSNNHRAQILHPVSLSVVIALFLIVQFGLNFFTFFSPSVLGFASSITPEQVVALANQKRTEQGLNPLVINLQLNEAAQRKAGDMFAFNYWAHTSPSGRTPWDFFKEVGYKYVYAGENLARDFMDSENVVKAWMNSPTHRDNLLNQNYKETGLAVVNGTLNGVETTLVVQVFGTPTPAPMAKHPQPPVVVRPMPKLGEASIAFAQAESETSSLPLFSPFWLTKTIVIFMLGVVLGALLLDIILVYQRRIIRLSGRNIAHLVFIGTLFLAVILTTPGVIL